MLDLSSITLLGMVGKNDQEYLARLMRVYRWCESIATWEGKVLFTVIEPPPMPGLRVVQIPDCDKPGWEVLFSKTIPQMMLDYEYTMAIHDDGFPIQPELWTDEFLKYDYVAAPWHDGVIGSGGMALASGLFNYQTKNLPWCKGDTNCDAWYCRVQREQFESRGVKFAPTDLADRYCTESMRKEQPSFGFHGRRDCAEKYKLGWEKIEAFEKENGF